MFRLIIIYYVYFNLNYILVKTQSGRSNDEWYLEQSVSCIHSQTSTKPVNQQWPPMPHAFEYEIRDPYGNEQYRRERSDGRRVTGSYGYYGPDGIYRHVDYIADEYGFRANIRTNEPGVGYENPASVRINGKPYTYPSPPPPPPSPPFSNPPGRALPPIPTPVDTPQPTPPFGTRTPPRGQTPDYGQRDAGRQPRPPGTQPTRTPTPGSTPGGLYPSLDTPSFGNRGTGQTGQGGYGGREGSGQPAGYPSPPFTSPPGGRVLPPVGTPPPGGTRTPSIDTGGYGGRGRGNPPLPSGTQPPRPPTGERFPPADIPPYGTRGTGQPGRDDYVDRDTYGGGVGQGGKRVPGRPPQRPSPSPFPGGYGEKDVSGRPGGPGAYPSPPFVGVPGARGLPPVGTTPPGGDTFPPVVDSGYGQRDRGRQPYPPKTQPPRPPYPSKTPSQQPQYPSKVQPPRPGERYPPTVIPPGGGRGAGQPGRDDGISRPRPRPAPYPDGYGEREDGQQGGYQPGRKIPPIPPISTQPPTEPTTPPIDDGSYGQRDPSKKPPFPSKTQPPRPPTRPPTQADPTEQSIVQQKVSETEEKPTSISLTEEKDSDSSTEDKESVSLTEVKDNETSSSLFHIFKHFLTTKMASKVNREQEIE